MVKNKTNLNLSVILTNDPINLYCYFVDSLIKIEYSNKSFKCGSHHACMNIKLSMPKNVLKITVNHSKHHLLFLNNI